MRQPSVASSKNRIISNNNEQPDKVQTTAGLLKCLAGEAKLSQLLNSGTPPL